MRSGGSVVAEAWKGMLEARISRRGGHPQAAALCESSAMGHLALREWQLALRDTPADIVIMLRLANIHQERGEHDKSLRLLEEVLSIEPSNLEGLRRAAGLLREEDNLQRLRQLLARGVAAGLPEAEARRLKPAAPATLRSTSLSPRRWPGTTSTGPARWGYTPSAWMAPALFAPWTWILPKRLWSGRAVASNLHRTCAPGSGPLPVWFWKEFGPWACSPFSSTPVTRGDITGFSWKGLN